MKKMLPSACSTQSRVCNDVKQKLLNQFTTHRYLLLSTCPDNPPVLDPDLRRKIPLSPHGISELDNCQVDKPTYLTAIGHNRSYNVTKGDFAFPGV